MPTEPLYHSPIGLYPCQAEAVALGYLRESNLFEWDTGTGKSHLAMASAALLFEDDLIDRVLLVCKKNKLKEWVRDFKKFTKLSVALYHGTDRKKLLVDPPQVLVTTYETSRTDAAVTEVVKGKNGRNTKRIVPGELTIHLQGQRVLVIYDEMSDKLSNRSSGIYKSHHLLWSDLYKAGHVRTMGLTATPMKKDPEGYFNIGRILTPSTMGTVAQFESDHVVYRNQFHTIGRAKNLTEEDCEPGVVPLRAKMDPIVSRKSKNDPDIRDQFPHQIEEWSAVEMGDKEAKFYNAVENEYGGDDDAVFTVLRQIAGHPLSISHSPKDTLGWEIAQEVGHEGLAAIGSAKLDTVLEDLKTIVKGQGSQVVIFTFFGQSVFKVLYEALRASDYSVAQYHGQMTPTAREEAQDAFRGGDRQVFLTSDAGSDGINLPEAQYVLNYDAPLTHTNYMQRIGRVSRIDSDHPTVFARTYVVEGTVEEGIIEVAYKRNKWHDQLTMEDADQMSLTAEMRKAARELARARTGR